MSKLSISKSKLNSPYYSEFFGIDGPLSLWLNDYVLKYGNNNNNVIFEILNDCLLQINNNKSVNKKLYYLFNFYNNKLKRKYIKYKYVNIPKENVVFKVGQYIIGEKVALPFS